MTDDEPRARVLADHRRWYQAGLHNHHHGEDELIWPLLHAVVIEHLDDEEVRLLPLASRYLNQHEWNALGEHFGTTTPESELLIFLGSTLAKAR